MLNHVLVASGQWLVASGQWLDRPAQIGRRDYGRGGQVPGHPRQDSEPPLAVPGPDGGRRCSKAVGLTGSTPCPERGCSRGTLVLTSVRYLQCRRNAAEQVK